MINLLIESFTTVINKKVVPFLIIVLLISSCTARSSNPEKTVDDYFGNKTGIENLDNFIISKMDSLDIPGLSFALINDGEVVHHKTIAYANVEQKIPVTNQTIFEGASLSKSVFFCDDLR